MATRSKKLWKMFSICCWFGAAAASISPAQVRAEDGKPFRMFYLGFAQDSVFGPTPFMGGVFGIDEQSSFTFYDIIYTSAVFGGYGFSGANELGGGYSHRFFNGDLNVGGTFGIMSGNFLSGRGTGPTRFPDGLAFRLNVDYAADWFELQARGLYGLHLVNDNAHPHQNLPLWSIAPGVKLDKNFSIGLHYEQCKIIAVPAGGGASTTSDAYVWYGGYFQVLLPNSVTFRFSGGRDTSDAAKATSSDGRSATGWFRATVAVPFFM